MGTCNGAAVRCWGHVVGLMWAVAAPPTLPALPTHTLHAHRGEMSKAVWTHKYDMVRNPDKHTPRRSHALQRPAHACSSGPQPAAHASHTPHTPHTHLAHASHTLRTCLAHASQTLGARANAPRLQPSHAQPASARPRQVRPSCRCACTKGYFKPVAGEKRGSVVDSTAGLEGETPLDAAELRKRELEAKLAKEAQRKKDQSWAEAEARARRKEEATRRNAQQKDQKKWEDEGWQHAPASRAAEEQWQAHGQPARRAAQATQPYVRQEPSRSYYEQVGPVL